MYELEQNKAGKWVIYREDNSVVFVMREKDEDFAREILCNLNSTTDEDA